MTTLERGLLAIFGLCWLMTVAHLFGQLPLAGRYDLSLYAYYGLAAAMGWLAGNVWVARRRRVDRRLAVRLLIFYLFAPPSGLYLLHAAASVESRRVAPLAAVWALGVYVIFFLVPVTLKPKNGTPPRPKIGRGA